MTKKFVLNVKPFSINAIHYRDGKRKTVEAREWECTIFNALSTTKHLADMKELKTAFDPLRHGFAIKLTCYYPEIMYKTKLGNISSKTMDITNWEKPLVDVLFLDKYSLYDPPFGVQNLQTDDKYIVSMHSRKLSHKEPNTKIEIVVKLISVT